MLLKLYIKKNDVSTKSRSTENAAAFNIVFSGRIISAPIWKADDGVPYNKLKLLSFAEEGCTYDTCVVAELGDDDIGILF